MRSGRSRGGAATVLALVAGVAGALASCNLVVGVGDYTIGDADTDGTATEGVDASAGPDVDLADGTLALSDVASGLDASAKGDVGSSKGEAAVDAVDGGRSAVDSPNDSRYDSPGDGGGSRDSGGALSDAIDASAAVDSGDGTHATADASDAAPVIEAAALQCGQGLLTGQSDFQKLVSTCLLAISCDPYFFNVTLSQCITYDYLESTGSIACLSTIQDCAGFYSCEGRRSATMAECPTGSTSVTCDATNNLAIDCGAGVVTNCAKYGGTCGTYVDATGSLAVGCEVVPACTPGDGGDQCQTGNKFYSCAPSGVGYGRDCTTIGATCLSNSVDGTSCYYDAPACSDVGTSTCNGDTLNDCTLEGRGLKYNCTRAAGSCAIDNAGTGYCLAPGCSLSSTCSESCSADGHTLNVCVGSAPFAIDCSQYAPFTSCNQVKDSAGNPYAYCF